MPIAQRVRKEDLHGGLLFLRHPQNDPRVYFNYSTSVFYIQPFYCHPLETKKDSHFRASPYGSSIIVAYYHAYRVAVYCVIRRVRPTNSKLTVGLRSKQ